VLSRSIRLSVREVSMYLGNLDNDDDDDYNSVATNNKPVITGNWNHLKIIQKILVISMMMMMIIILLLLIINQ